MSTTTSSPAPSTTTSLPRLVGASGHPADMPREASPSRREPQLPPTPSALAAPPNAAGHVPRPIGVDAALEALQLTRETAGVAACLAEGDERRRVRCLVGLRFAADPKAAELALGLHDALGDVVGLEVERDMDGGWRGPIHLVPALPVAQRRKHLEWVVEARRSIARFIDALARGQERRPSFADRPLTLLFTRSVGKRTPSAYAFDWTIVYNVEGSLHRSREAVRETMIHETFHLVDASHGAWSERVLGPLYDAILRRCDVEGRVVASRACLRPYAPHATTVVGGTYYAFQPGSGVGEYAAELAVRYVEEQRAAMAGRRHPGGAFQCGPAENARAWRLLVEEFFAGIDHTLPCPR